MQLLLLLPAVTNFDHIIYIAGVGMAEIVGIIGSSIAIANSAATLSRALFDIVETIKNARKEIADIAQQLQLLSGTLHLLWDFIHSQQNLCRPVLFHNTNAILEQYLQVDKELRELIQTPKSLARLTWCIKRNKVKSLLKKVEAVKTSLTLALNVVQLARFEAVRPPANESSHEGRAIPNRFRKLVESAVQANRQVVESAQRDDAENTHPRSDQRRAEVDVYREGSFDTATWLYHLVFSSDATLAPHQDTSDNSPLVQVPETAEGAEQAVRLARSKPASTPKLSTDKALIVWGRQTEPGRVVDRLLSTWTTLTQEQIDLSSTRQYDEDWRESFLKVVEKAKDEDAWDFEKWDREYSSDESDDFESVIEESSAPSQAIPVQETGPGTGPVTEEKSEDEGWGYPVWGGGKKKKKATVLESATESEPLSKSTQPQIVETRTLQPKVTDYHSSSDSESSGHSLHAPTNPTRDRRDRRYEDSTQPRPGITKRHVAWEEDSLLEQPNEGTKIKERGTQSSESKDFSAWKVLPTYEPSRHSGSGRRADSQQAPSVPQRRPSPPRRRPSLPQRRPSVSQRRPEPQRRRSRPREYREESPPLHHSNPFATSSSQYDYPGQPSWFGEPTLPFPHYAPFPMSNTAPGPLPPPRPFSDPVFGAFAPPPFSDPVFRSPPPYGWPPSVPPSSVPPPPSPASPATAGQDILAAVDKIIESSEKRQKFEADNRLPKIIDLLTTQQEHHAQIEADRAKAVAEAELKQAVAARDRDEEKLQRLEKLIIQQRDEHKEAYTQWKAERHALDAQAVKQVEEAKKLVEREIAAAQSAKKAARKSLKVAKVEAERKAKEEADAWNKEQKEKIDQKAEKRIQKYEKLLDLAIEERAVSVQSSEQPLVRTCIIDGNRSMEIAEYTTDRYATSNTLSASMLRDTMQGLRFDGIRDMSRIGPRQHIRPLSSIGSSQARNPPAPDSCGITELSQGQQMILFPSNLNPGSAKTTELQSSLADMGLETSFDDTAAGGYGDLSRVEDSVARFIRSSVFWEAPSLIFGSELLSTYRMLGWRPPYTRSSDAGHTYFLGSQPVHTYFFRPDYKPQLSPCKGSVHTETIMIDKALIEEYALVESGFDFDTTDAGSYILDGRLQYSDIEALIERSFAMRETYYRRAHRQLDWHRKPMLETQIFETKERSPTAAELRSPVSASRTETFDYASDSEDSGDEDDEIVQQTGQEDDTSSVGTHPGMELAGRSSVASSKHYASDTSWSSQSNNPFRKSMGMSTNSSFDSVSLRRVPESIWDNPLILLS